MASPAASATRAESKIDVPTQLKNAVIAAQKQLGELEPWQKRVFEEEVIPGHQRFIRDYRASGQGLVVDVDYESIRNYLKFYGPKALRKPGEAAPSQPPKVLIGLKFEVGCARCAEASPEIRQMAQERMERRGLQPVWATEGELKFGGKALSEHLVRLAGERRIPAVLLITWENAPVDPNDSSHADEVRFLVRSMLWLQELPRHEGQLEILENDSIGRTAHRLMTDFMTELGSKLGRASLAGPAGDEKEKLRVEISGIRNFPHYLEVKAQLLSISKDGVAVEEKRLSKGKAVFAVSSEKPVAELKRMISALGMDAKARVSFEEPSAQIPNQETGASP